MTKNKQSVSTESEEYLRLKSHLQKRLSGENGAKIK